MNNNFVKQALSVWLILCSTFSYAQNKNQIIVNQFNGWSQSLNGSYSYDDLVKEHLAGKNEFLIIATLRTRPVLVDALIVVNSGNSSAVLFISSEYNRKVSCTSVGDPVNVGAIRDRIISEIEDIEVGSHPYYTIIEKKKNNERNLYTFGSYSNPDLRKEVDTARVYIFESMLNKCRNIEIQ